MKTVNPKENTHPSKRETTPNIIFLTFNQTSLRLRHLTQIIGYNFTYIPDGKQFISNSLPSFLPRPTPKNGYYFTMESSSLEGGPEYTSDLLHSNCPLWESFNCETIFPVHLLSRKGIVVRVWLQKDNENVPITSWGVNFSGLVPISSKPLSGCDFLANTLVFKLRGRYFTTWDNLNTSVKEKEKQPVELHRGYPLPPFEIRSTYSVPFLSRLHSMKRALRHEERKKENLRKSLELKGVKSESRRTNLQKEIENLKIRICLLMNQLETEINKLRAIKLAADNIDSENQDKGIELLEGYQTLNKHLGAFRTREAKLQEENETLKDIVGKMKERRCQLLSQLPLIFPVQKILDEGVKYAICDVGLPDAENFDGFSDQSLGVALGYVAQLLVKIAFLVNIPLKYPITLRGSLSSIADLTSTQLSDAETQFPLYTRGKEKEKLHFNYGVFLLNKNIAQLRWSCGLTTVDLRPTLQNLWTFLCCLHDKSSAPPRAFMPDAVVPPLILPASLRNDLQTPTTLLHHQTPRLPLNPVNPHHRSLNEWWSSHAPSSPKSRIPKKSSLEEDYFMCSASDVESKLERRESDDTHSDIDSSSTFRVNSPILKYYSGGKLDSQKLTGDNLMRRPMSFSLDHGLNYIKEGDKKINSRLQRSSLKALHFTHIPTHSSGSFPDLALERRKDDQQNTAEEPPLANLSEQTTELLRSWHENDPSPYCTVVTGSNSSDKLENGVKTDSTTQPKRNISSPELLRNSVDSKVDPSSFERPNTTTEFKENDTPPVIPNCVKKSAKEEEKPVEPHQPLDKVFSIESSSALLQTDKNPTQSSEMEIFQRRLVKEMGVSLSDFGLEEDSFLDDVASRTANLASQNCSFKLSFAKQSMPK